MATWSLARQPTSLWRVTGRSRTGWIRSWWVLALKEGIETWQKLIQALSGQLCEVFLLLFGQHNGITDVLKVRYRDYENT